MTTMRNLVCFVFVTLGLAASVTCQETGTILTCEVLQCAFGVCLEGEDSLSNATCQCLEGYEGMFCDMPTNECSSNPCLNGATCVDRVAQYQCVCAPGFDGTNCEEETGPCLSSPCQHGTCANKFGTDTEFFTCTCEPGWAGDFCEIDIDECIVLNFPCINGDCNDLLNGYNCSCYPGWSGYNCTDDIDECSSDPCQNGGVCNNLQNAFNCTCPVQWEGSDCSQEKNACADSPCLNGGTCNNFYTFYTCTCGPNYFGDNCQEDSGICYATGDPHYLTFDGLWHNFQGECEYVLVRECIQDSPVFQVDVTNAGKSNSTGTFTYQVRVQVLGSDILLKQDGVVFVEGRLITLPSQPQEGVWIRKSGLFVEIDVHVISDTDMTIFYVKWDGERTIEVRLPAYLYMGSVCGLCGNFDRNETNEFLTPEGVQVNDTQTFGNSWIVDTSCQTQIQPENPCDINSAAYVEAQGACSVITDPEGPFGNCHDRLDPLPYYTACLLDGCIVPSQDLNATVCHLIEFYSQSCADREVLVQSWRNQSFCGVTCPVDTAYSWCTSACPSTCVDVLQGTMDTCDRKCTESCECTGDLVLDGTLCVSQSECGCIVDGFYYSSGATIYTPGCFTERICTGNNVVTSTDLDCDSNAICGIDEDGIHGCNCRSGYTGDGRTCEDINECLSNPCVNGDCVNGINLYACNCAVGWSGYNCDEYIGCSSNPCMNGATCVPNEESYECVCAMGYNGTFCEINTDPCFQEPCQNGATCYSKGDFYNCTCDYGFMGTNCENEVNPCLSNPCQNNGTCSNFIDYYTCTCTGSFMGRQCETEYGVCYATGDPHYKTFDNLWHDFQGTCRYTLSMDCQDGTDSQFAVEVENRKRSQDSTVAYTYEVTVIVRNATFVLGQNRDVMVNNVRIVPPAEARGFKVSLSGIYVQIVTDFGLYVRWDGDSRVEVRVTADFKGRTCGLCGNYNGDESKEDEFRTPDGIFLSNEAAFGNSWVVGNDPSCIPQSDEVEPCLQVSDESIVDLGRRNCELIKDINGPFSSCHSYLDPGPFYRACVYDVCAYPGGADTVICDLLAAYTQACKYHYVDLPAWRNATFCPISCPSNSTYGVCTSACPLTCLDFRQANTTCYDRCVEGCECDPGFVLEGSSCVPADTCGCVRNGFYYAVGSVQLNAQCSESCECLPGGIINCTSVSCNQNAMCGVRDGQSVCVCLDGYAGNGLRCLDIDECASSPCINGTCIDQINQFQCDCFDGWKGRLCDTTDECFSNPCTVNGRCVDGDNSYNCICDPGYEGVNCENEIDECASDPCTHDSTCFDGVASYTCQCSGGYTGPNCEDDINECRSMPCMNEGNCFNLVDRFLCECAPGWKGETCEIVDTPCTPGICQNGGLCTPISMDVYICECLDGFLGDNCEIDFDECFSNPCMNQATCVDGANRYTCSCQVGWAGDRCTQTDLPRVTVVQLWSDSFTAAWSVEIPVNWFRMQYRQIGTESWTYEPTISGNQLLYVLQGLRPDTEYEFRIGMQRAQDDSVAYTLAQPVRTCVFGYGSPPNCAVDSNLRAPFNIGIQNSRPSSLTITWDRNDTIDDVIVVQQRILGSEEWTNHSVISRPVTMYDVAPLQGHTYYEVRLVLPSTGEKSLVARFHTCEPGRGGANCEYLYATCTVWGDPHYITFDNLKYNFQGDCEYTLITDDCVEGINLSDLPNFSLISKNTKRKPSDRVSLVQEVSLNVAGSVYTLLRDGEVRVNGFSTALPIQSQDGVKIIYAGSYVILSTSFELTVRWDGRNTVEVTIPQWMGRAVCGMCGIYDDNDANDFTTPNGGVVSGANEFGQSWLANADQCNSEPPTVDPCTGEKLSRATELCSLLLNTNVWPSMCISYIDPQPYYDACVFDLCATLPDEDYLCDSLSEYAQACRQAGGPVVDWRSQATQCALVCPEGKVYDACASACQPTCATGFNAGADCVYPCIETCRCPDGYLQDGNDRCVQPVDCGCVLSDGTYMQSGSSVIDETCSSKCTCLSATYFCESYACQPFAECSLKSGVMDCYCRDGFITEGDTCIQAPGMCVVWGDPHYITFDNLMYDFQGDCEYTLVKDCRNTTSLPSFHLTAQNSKRKPSDIVSYLQELRLDYLGSQFTFIRGGEVRLDGVTVTLPLLHPSGVVIRDAGPYLEMATDFELIIKYDRGYATEITVPSTYRNRTCGLCGTFDDDQNNDLIFPNGTMASSAYHFANSWVVNGDECNVLPEVPNPCNDETSELFLQATDLCYALIQEAGPFSLCYDFVDPTPYYDSCLYDLCVTLPDEELLCSSLSGYADACRAAGGTPGDWRAARTQCAVVCEDGKVFDACASPCPATCVDRNMEITCPNVCVEGCTCPNGSFLDAGRCIQEEQCGCMLEEGIYLQSGETWTQPDCSRRCTCNGGQLECQDYGCHEFARCRPKGGVRGCYCLDGFTGDGQSCTRAPGVCSAWGDPHYITFDGFKYDFQGDCEYTLVRNCRNTSEEQSFHVIAKNVKNKPSARVSFTRDVVLELGGTVYSLLYQKEIRIDGVTVTPPVLRPDGVNIRVSGKNLVLTTDFQLEIRWDGQHNVEVEVPLLYWNNTCGLCGTFDGDAENDFRVPDGSLVDSPAVFGDSWMLDAQCSSTPEVPNPCDEDNQIASQANDLCYILLDKSGPFATCHDFVDPTKYQEGCAYDLCATLPDEQLLCDSLDSYAQSCQNAGGTPGDWKAQTPQCRMQCSGDLIYDSCGTACPATCQEPTASTNCAALCTETCRCPDGLLLEGNRCIESSECGCLLNNGLSYIPLGDVWISPDCTEKCICGGVCSTMECDESATCDIRDGVRNCYCKRGFDGDGITCQRGPATCTAWGDPHYITFDGAKYDFQGDCEYTLVRDCHNSSNLTSFHVIAKNLKRKPSDRVSLTREVVFDFRGTLYSLLQDGEVRINGVTVTLPVMALDGVTIRKAGKDVMLTTTFDVELVWDGRYTVKVTVPESYWNRTCGLCGTFDGDDHNEYRRPDGSLANSPVEFGNSWAIQDGECEPFIDGPDPCVEPSLAYDQATDLCYVLINKRGPFASCHDFVDPAPYHESCVFDLCVTLPDDDLLCDSLQSYAEACRENGQRTDDWKETIPECQLQCPGEFVYDSCGSACQASCQEPEGNVDCPESCIETCRCPDGLLLEGDHCIRPSECGCLLSDGMTYIPSGDQWVAPGCSQRCTCEGGEAQCSSIECDESAECDIRGGVRNCFCKRGFEGDGITCQRGPATCTAWGDPHYITFDGAKYDFQGDCEYTLVRDCHNSSDLTSFHVIAKNLKQKPSDRVSLTREVVFDFRGTLYSLLQDGEVRINGVTVTLPVMAPDGVTIRKAGRDVMLTTIFDVELVWDGRYTVKVTVPESYWNRTCGLCGTYDGDQHNEYRRPDGTLANSPVEFGNSWAIEDGECEPVIDGPDPCVEPSHAYDQATDLCYVLINKRGPFTSCHDFVDPAPYHESCVFDLCVTLPDDDLLCDSLQSYAEACREAGQRIDDWKDDLPKCQLKCPRELIYDSCGSACQASCQEPEGNVDCPESCIETCRCPDGLLLEGDHCIRPSECGCILSDGMTYIPSGDQWVAPDCSQRCTCEGGEAQCSSMECDESAECDIRGGVRNCFCKRGFEGDGITCQRGPATCTAWGDPHYITFDGAKYDFQGDCEYTLVRDCHNSSNLTSFHVIAKNLKQKPSDRVSLTREVVFDFRGTLYSLLQDGEVRINGVTVTLPVMALDGVTIRKAGKDVMLTTTFDVELVWDGRYTVKVTVPESYWERTCGLCGTYDGDQHNEYRRPDGTLANSPVEFGNSWAIEDGECEPVIDGPDPCVEPSHAYDQATDLCYVLINKRGPFASCHDFVDPAPYHESCVFDLCVTLPDDDLLCDSLQSYAEACRENGQRTDDWKETIPECRLQCPSEFIYDSCGSACQASCQEPEGNIDCPESCVETCRCPDGLVLEGDRCIRPSECGCLSSDGMTYIPSGDQWVAPDCSQRCTCEGGETQCSSMECDESAECDIRGGVRNCFCKRGFEGDGITCQRGPATCTAWGDPHYITFDGAKYDFQGDCEYTLVRDCHNSSNLTSFHVIAKNLKQKPSDRVSLTREVVFDFRGTLYSLLQDGEVRINGVTVTLPVMALDGVTIRKAGKDVMLTTTFDVQLVWDGRYTVKVTVPESYWERTCGLCGTFDGDDHNEYRRPDGTLANSPVEFGNSWAIEDGECEPVIDGPDPCVEPSHAYDQATDLCYVLINKRGPFTSCHDFVDPAPYHESCVFDLCVTLPDDDLLCDSLQSYAEACREAGQRIDDWKDDLPKCQLKCPRELIYDSCGSACQASCQEPEGNVDCPESCIETCRCPDGLLLEGDHCIRPSECGCILSDGMTYIPSGDQWVAPDCSQRCTCEGGEAQCSSMECDESAECDIRGGVRNCFCKRGFEGDGITCQRGPATCTAWGDPHYITFDGAKYDFQGDCEYTLVRDCHNSSNLTSFHVIAKNLKQKPSDRVSLTREVVFDFRGTLYSLLQDGEVRINGVTVTLPVMALDGVTIRKAGKDVMLTTTFDVQLVWDGRYTVKVTVPESYWERTCGLCGTFDGDDHNEYRRPDGTLANSPVEFGNSWAIEDGECEPVIDGPDPCVEPSHAYDQATDLCYVLINKRGPFTSCHDFVDPAPYHESCVFDLCVTLPDDDLLCDSLQSYAEACREAGQRIDDWKDDLPKCQLKCPRELIYDSCGSACQASCQEPEGNVDCPESCIETCRCPDGLLLEGDHCIRPSECGCILSDGMTYIPSGDQWVAPDCSQRCTCEGGEAQCSSMECDESAECDIRGGVRNCFCKRGFEGDGITCQRGPATCTAWGDPHYITFDGAKYDFQGDCEYTLVRDCHNSSNLTSFHVIAKNLKQKPSDRVSLTREVVFDFRGNLYSLLQDGEVRINGVTVTLPVIALDGVTIRKAGKDVMLTTTFDVELVWDGRYTVKVTVPESYWNRTCGLCGTFDGDDHNEYRRPDGSLANSPVEFGNSWAIEDGECEPVIDGPDPCVEPSHAYDQATDLCYVLINKRGPFASCHDFVDPAPYHESCVFDLCVTLPDDDLLCDSLQSYAEACREAGQRIDDWKDNVPECQLQCPSEFIYESCGSACQASCQEPEGNVDCPESCMETCRCPDGLLLEGNHCIRPSECGCLLSDGMTYIPSGEQWVAPDCSQICTCEGGEAQCSSMECDESAECAIRGGVRNCFCKRGFEGDGITCQRGPATCTAWGDPHYITFDGAKYDFQGDCEYTLVRDCHNSSNLTSFHVIAKNLKQKPSDRVSLTREVVFDFRGTLYSLLQDGEVRINGVTVTLPVMALDGVTIRQAGKDVMLTTTFDVELVWDGRYTVKVTVPESYWERTCGLCGTFDGDDHNEYKRPDGSLANSPVEFGNSWAIEDGECEPVIDGPDPCVEPSRAYDRASDLCYVLINKRGPFTSCHDFVDPSPYHESCVFDLCVTLPDDDLLCDSLQSYAEACREAGKRIDDWKEDLPKCQLKCPRELIYDSCGTACQASCQEPEGNNVDCPESCIETCRCPDGLLLEGDHCIRPSECGCLLSDGMTYIPSGDQWVAPDCSQRCTCEGGEAQCSSIECDESAECDIRGGVRNCFCKRGFEGDGKTCQRGPGTCTAWGDPHYITFDGAKYDFQGECEYTLVRDCHNSFNLTSFHVIAKNLKRKPSDRVSLTREVVFDFRGTLYSLLQDGEVRINGVTVTLPVVALDGVIIRKAGKDLMLTTSVDVELLWDGRNTVKVTVPETYWNRTCGLCGTFDGDTDNDFRLPGGSLVQNRNEFGNSWAIEDGECEPVIDGPDPCVEPSHAYDQATDLCYVLINKIGPFASCHDFVDPAPYHESCVFDLCVTLPGDDLLCDSLQSYAEACREAGQRIDGWKEDLPKCQLKCPSELIYDSCGSACQASCQEPEGNVDCPESCIETCRCPDGLLLEGDQCIRPSECGCLLSDGLTYIPNGESWVAPDCSQRCTCEGGEAQCSSMECDESAQCDIKNGVRDCYCNDGFAGDGLSCIKAPGVCTIWGDPHYVTFDGLKYDFQGDCDYTLIKECTNSSQRAPFVVSARNLRDKPSAPVAYMREVWLDYGGSRYSLRSKGELRIDDVIVTTPVQRADGVHVRNDGFKLILMTSFGLTIHWDGYRTAEITLSSRYSNRTCGLCGNFDGSSKNEFVAPEGHSVSSPNEFGNSWVSDQDDRCIDQIIDPSPCDDRPENQEQAEDLCYIIIKVTGPFDSCHDYVDPTPYHEACVYDLCAYLPDDDLVCDSVASYAQACSKKGVTIGNWRQHVEQCKRPCPDGMIFDPCGDACQRTCAMPMLADDDVCNETCVETCRCPEGQVVEGGRCVPRETCGCVLPNGDYLKAGDVWVDDDCSNRCHCNGSQVVCESYGCHERAECRVVNGVRDCACPRGYSGDGRQNCVRGHGVCLIWGDPHYVTFDGRRFNFQGDCEYTLVDVCRNDTVLTAPVFTITSQNVRRKPEAQVSYVQRLKLELYGKVFMLNQPGSTNVEGVDVKLPYAAEEGVSIWFTGTETFLATDFGLYIRWDGYHTAEITVPPAYSGLLCGLCGNYDAIPWNDLMLPNGTETTSEVTFGQSWVVDEASCDWEPVDPQPCQDFPNVTLGRDLCYVIKKPNGPFSECNMYGNPDPFYDACVYDACASLPDVDVICDDISVYADGCNGRGFPPKQWRSEDFCPSNCSGGQVYSTCAPNCPDTCASHGDLLEAYLCDSCEEGCVCPPGLILDNQECVPTSHCGCSDNGVYYSIGDEWLREGCTDVCFCPENGTTECRTFECHGNATCGVREGQRACVCNEGFVGDGVNCTQIYQPVTVVATTLNDLTTIEENPTTDLSTTGQPSTTYSAESTAETTTQESVDSTTLGAASTLRSTTELIRIEESTTDEAVFETTTQDPVTADSTTSGAETTLRSTTELVRTEESTTDEVVVETTTEAETTVEEATTSSAPVTEPPTIPTTVPATTLLATTQPTTQPTTLVTTQQPTPTTQPGTLYDLAVTNKDSTSLTVSWTLYIEVAALQVEWRPLSVGSDFQNGPALLPSVTEYTITGLNVATTYEVRLALPKDGTTLYGDSVFESTCPEGFTNLLCSEDFSVYGLTLVTATSSSLSLSWRLTSETEWNRVEYQLPGDTSWREGPEVSGSTTEATLFGLEPQQTVLVRIHARTLANSDAYTDQNTYETCSNFYQGATCQESLPYDGSIFARGSSSLTFQLDSSLEADTVTGQYRTGSAVTRQSWQTGPTVPASRQVYILFGLDAGFNYDVRFVFIAEAGNATISQTYSVATCVNGFQGINCQSDYSASVYDLKLVEATSNYITVSWELDVDISSYEVQIRQQSDSEWTTLGQLTPGRQALTIESLSPLTYYVVRVLVTLPGETEVISSEEVVFLTCPQNYNGINCENYVPTTQAPVTTMTTPFTNTFSITSVNSISITGTWVTSMGVGFVQLQFRVLNSLTWRNGTLTLGQHTVYVLRGLVQETTYEVRVLYGLDDKVVASDVIVVRTCRRGWQGRTQCDTDYTSIGAFDVVLQLATSSSLDISWELMVDAGWNLVQYQLSGESEWQNSTRLPGDATSASVAGLRPGLGYSMRVLTQRIQGGFDSSRGRRQAEEEDGEVGVSASVSYATCFEGTMGLNCEQEVVLATVSPEVPLQTLLYIMFGVLAGCFVVLFASIAWLHRRWNRRPALHLKDPQADIRSSDVHTRRRVDDNISFASMPGRDEALAGVANRGLEPDRRFSLSDRDMMPSTSGRFVGLPPIREMDGLDQARSERENYEYPRNDVEY